MTSDNTRWRKSSYSGGQGGNCVEVRDGRNVIAVRDTTDRQGPILTVSPSAWQTFTERLRNASLSSDSLA